MNISIGTQVDFYPSNKEWKSILNELCLGEPFSSEAYNINLKCPLKAEVIHIHKKVNFLFHESQSPLDLKVYYGKLHRYVINCTLDQNKSHLNSWNYLGVDRPKYKSYYYPSNLNLDEVYKELNITEGLEILNIINNNDEINIICKPDVKKLHHNELNFSIFDGKKVFKNENLDSFFITYSPLVINYFLGLIDEFINIKYIELNNYKTSLYKLLNGGELNKKQI